MTSGIPRGSVLGPLLFVIYINDLPSVPSKGAETYLYADDTKLCKGIFDETDMESLQSDLYEVCKWSKKWQLSFLPNKCKVMRLHVGRPKEQTKKFAYKLEENSAPLEYVTQEKDLGLIIDENLSFEQHIAEKIKKANSIMGVIRRTMEHLDCYYFKLLFTASDHI